MRSVDPITERPRAGCLPARCDNRGMSNDLLEIERLLYDYAWGCDEGDWVLLRSVFCDGAELDYSSTGGPVGGPDEVVAWLESSLTGIRIQHVVSNFRIDVTGDAAAGKAMFFTTVHLVGLNQPLTTGGYYDLELVREDGAVETPPTLRGQPLDAPRARH